MESLTVLPTATLLQEKCTYFFVVFIKFPFTIYITRTILRLLTLMQIIAFLLCLWSHLRLWESIVQDKWLTRNSHNIVSASHKCFTYTDQTSCIRLLASFLEQHLEKRSHALFHFCKDVWYDHYSLRSHLKSGQLVQYDFNTGRLK